MYADQSDYQIKTQELGDLEGESSPKDLGVSVF